MSSFASRIGLVSAFTMISRVLGLARDMLTSAMLGATVWNSAFITAFTLPNLFRRLLGEGALTAALMPNLSEELESRGRGAVHDLVNKTLSWLLLTCLALTVVAVAALELAKRLELEEKWTVAAGLAQIVFPYVLLVCLAAILSAALNLFSRFGVPALTAVWLNVSIIVALGYGGWWLGHGLEGRTYWLCGGALFGGLLQMLAPAFALSKEGWRPRFDLKVSPRLREVAWLTAPGIFGAAVFQVNVLVSRGLAFYIDDAAASLLYYANRLVELPVGVFAVAISTVVFPSLTRAIAGGRLDEFARTYKKGIALCLLLAAPSAVGLAVLAPEIIALLFQRGLFTGDDTRATAPLVVVFAIGMPFYAFVSVETRAFFSLKDTSTPVRVAAWAFVVNLILSVALIGPYGALGLAVASNAAAAGQALALHAALRRKGLDTRLRDLSGDAWRICLAASLMGWTVYALAAALAPWQASGVFRQTGGLVLCIVAGMASYVAVLRVTGLDWRRMWRDDH